MNEVLTQIAKQAMVEHCISHVRLQEFAELIIKEYEKFLPEQCPWSKADESGPMKGWHVQFVARKHFGIEE